MPTTNCTHTDRPRPHRDSASPAAHDDDGPPQAPATQGSTGMAFGLRGVTRHTVAARSSAGERQGS